MRTVRALVILAHQGGWDEVLLVLGPILVMAGLLVVAKKRVARAARQASGAPPTFDDGGPVRRSRTSGGDE